jgi:hypothetical protein
MKARPLLFSPPMARALLDGRKTQTRRPIKPQPIIHDNGSYRWDGCLGGFKGCAGTHVEDFPKLASWYCPYGKVDDLIWVRESFRIERSAVESVYYRADEEWHKGAGWKPSIHIPRWASRLTLKITNVRVERLQEISEVDAIAEGCRPYFDKKNTEIVGCLEMQPLISPQEDYARLWRSLNGDKSWDINPYVWVIEFEVHKMNVDSFIRKTNPAA